MSDATDSEAVPRTLTDELKTEIRNTYDALKKGLPGFRARRSQGQMIAVASRTLATPGAVAIVEAPTGTGKSLAYLTAGVPTAQAHKLKLIIATGTVALQEQLADRDVPNFLKTTQFPLRTVLAKGRQRFLCPRNATALINNGPQETISFGDDDEDLQTPAWPRAPRPGEADVVSRLTKAWAERQWDGDLDRAPETVDAELRPLLTTSAGACTNKRCDFVDQCPFKLARERVEAADLVVVNHSLLLADLSLAGEEEGTYGGVILPKLSESLVVIDEGHNLSHTARETRAATVHASAAHKALLKLRKLVRACYQTLNKPMISKLTLGDGLKLLGELDQAWERFEKHVQLTWTPEHNGRDEPMWRAPLGQLPQDWQPFARELLKHARESNRWVSGVRRALMEAEGLPAGAKETLPRELGMALERLRDQLDLWEYWCHDEGELDMPIALWITLDPSGSLVFHAGAVSAADFLAERLFGQAAAVLVTSATISAGGDFDAVCRDLGLPGHAEAMSLPSPFDLAGNGRLVIPRMKSSAKDRDAHALEVAKWLDDSLDWDAGNLVLFTSRAKMDTVFKHLPAARQALCRVQGSKSKSRLLEEHSAAINGGSGSTLMGMNSWGEGMDLPGRLCTSVIITNLPFGVPTDPVEATLAEWMESRNRRPFDEISVPEATRVLTQFMGRLLRHEDDVGTVYVLDRRLADSGYGKRMLRALPGFTKQIQ